MHAKYEEFEEGGPPTFHPMHARYEEFEEGGPPTFHPMHGEGSEPSEAKRRLGAFHPRDLN